jgi:hypothetical protein
LTYTYSERNNIRKIMSTTFNISGSITTNDPISASYISASNIDGIVATASYALTGGVSGGSGGINGMAYFTASGTWTVPTGIQNVRVICIGGGGGAAPGPGGGGGGGYAEAVVSVSGFSTLPVTVGAGGGTLAAGGASGFLNVTASGGAAGVYGGAGNAAGGTGINATISVTGVTGNSNGGGVAGTLPWNWQLQTSLMAQSIYLNSIGGAGFGPMGSNNGAVVIYW